MVVMGICLLAAVLWLLRLEYQNYRFGRIRRFFSKIPAFFHTFATSLRRSKQELELRQQMQVQNFDPAKNALRRVIDSRLCPPDTVSAGAMYGGPALFFKHDGATEVFIGRNYDHAADKLIEWLRTEHVETQNTTRLNRKQRRAWKSNKRADLS